MRLADSRKGTTVTEATITVSPCSVSSGRSWTEVDGSSGWLLWAPKIAGPYMAEYIGRYVVVLRSYVCMDRED